MKKLLFAGLSLLISTFTFSQQELKGVVTGADGQPLPGASVVVLETGQGTAADKDGGFRLVIEMPGSYTVQASYVGFEENRTKVEIHEGAVTTLRLELSKQAFLLETLTVQATRAGDRAPFTYSTVGKEVRESRNLGPDVPFLLDATPSLVVPAVAGPGGGRGPPLPAHVQNLGRPAGPAHGGALLHEVGHPLDWAPRPRPHLSRRVARPSDARSNRESRRRSTSSSSGADPAPPAAPGAGFPAVHPLAEEAPK